MKIPFYILAGGRSSRFGSDKALAQIQGQPLIQRLISAVQPIASSTTIIADTPDKYIQFEVETIVDIIPDLGPVGGLYTAACHTTSQWFCILSCDMTHFNHTWASQLLSQSNPETHAVVFQNDRRHPFPGLYNLNAQPIIKQHVDQRKLAMQKLLNTLNTITLDTPEDWPTIAQVNTTEELDRYNANQ